MKLNEISISNFKGCQDIHLNLDDQLTVIIGANGAGKSTVLDAISIVLSWIIARIRNAKGQGRYISEDEIYNGFSSGSLEAKFDCIPSIVIPSKAKKGYTKDVAIDLKDLNQYCESVRAQIMQHQTKTSIPIFVNYGVRRAVVDIPLRIRKSHIFDLFETYEDSLRGDANFRTFFEWYRNQEDIENENIRERTLFKDNTPIHLDKELNAVRNAIKSFMPKFSNIRVSRNPLQMKIDKDGLTLSVNQLSDGEKIYIALVGDLCRRLALANPTLQDPLKGEGIVLIDELDLHLHPQWQSEIATRLCKTFPNIQFIVTTHSPLVITNIQSSQLRILSSEQGRTVVANSENGYAMPVSIILKDIMGISNELPANIEKLLDTVYQEIQDGDIENAQIGYSELLKLTPNLPDLVKIRKYIDIKSRKSK
jgi:predicted ATP-binding protein involved in virulence